MKITAAQLLQIADSGVFGQLIAQDLSPLGAYRIGRLASVIEPEALRVQCARNALITAGISIEENGVRRVKPECEAAFFASLQPILGEEIELAVRPITLDDLAGAKISPFRIKALGPLVTDPGD